MEKQFDGGSLLQIPDSSYLRKTLSELELLLGSADYDNEFERFLRDHSEDFTSFLSFPTRSESSQALISADVIETTGGALRLDKVPDVEQITILSEELNLDQIYALAYVLKGQDETGDVSASNALYQYYEERYAAIQCLRLLLMTQITMADRTHPRLYSEIGAFNAHLLTRSSSFINKLISLIKPSCSTLASDVNRLPIAIDCYGRTVDRVALVQRESLALLEILLLVVTLKQRVRVMEVEEILELLFQMAAHASMHNTVVAARQYTLCLFSFLLTVLPSEDAEGNKEAMRADDKALAELASSRSIQQQINSFSAESPVSEYTAIIKLGLGILSLSCDIVTKEAISSVSMGLKSCALTNLAMILNSDIVSDEKEDIRLIIASVAHQLLMLFVEVSKEGLIQLQQTTISAQNQELGGPKSIVDLAKAKHNAIFFNNRTEDLCYLNFDEDSMSSLMYSVSATLELHPGLCADESQRKRELSWLAQLGGSAELCNSPSFLMSYIRFWSSIATSAAGARNVFYQLLAQNAPEYCSWKRMFSTLRTIVSLYDYNEREQQKSTQDGLILRESDTRTLCSFAQLFRKVLLNGPRDEVANWVMQLDEEAGASPSWEILFQAMCSPVPQILKAALDNALEAVAACERFSSSLWEQILTAVIVLPFQQLQNGESSLPAGTSSIPHYDMSFQLNEIQAREDDYSEAVAFVSLLTTLWENSDPEILIGGGSQFLHFTRFIRLDILSSVFHRSFRDEAQRWELIASCLKHFSICLKQSELFLFSTTNREAIDHQIPAVEIIMDLISEGSICRTALHCLKIGVDEISNERNLSLVGKRKEQAALSSLQLFRAAFDIDANVIKHMQIIDAKRSYDNLESVFRHDRSRLFNIFDFVRYPYNNEIQVVTLDLVEKLVARIPDVPELLLSNPLGSDSGESVVNCLKDGFATCLSSSLHDLHDEDTEINSRSRLLLELLVGNLDRGIPNLTQLLCGFDLISGRMPFALISFRSQPSPLRIILDELQRPSFSVLQPKNFELCLKVIFRLCEDWETTGTSCLEVIRSHYGNLLTLLRTVIFASIKERSMPSIFHQKALSFSILTLQMYNLDPAIPSQKESLRCLLSDIVLVPKATKGSGTLADALHYVISLVPPEPRLFESCPRELHTALQTLNVEKALSKVQCQSVYGDVIFDEVTLKDALLVGFKDLISRQDGPDDSLLKQAARFTINFAANFNFWSQHIGGQIHALNSWAELVEIIFTKRYEMIFVSFEESMELCNMIATTLEHSLSSIDFLLETQFPSLASTLAGTIEILMGCMRDSFIKTVSSNVQESVASMNDRFFSIFQSFCNLLWKGRAHDTVRLSLTNAVSLYLSMCRKSYTFSEYTRLFPRTEEAKSNQIVLEEGNVAIMHSNLRLLNLLAIDCVSPNISIAAAASAAVSMWLVSDPSVVSADELHTASLPPRLLQEIVERKPDTISQLTIKGQSNALVVQTQLMLLMRIADAGPPAQKIASAQKLGSLQPIKILSKARILDIEPEDLGYDSFSQTSSLRRRMNLITGPVLRLILVILTSLSDSKTILEQAKVFVQDHEQLLVRILKDASRRVTDGWEPGDVELEEAVLAICLILELANRKIPVIPSLSESIYRLISRLFVVDSKSKFAPVISLRNLAESGKVITIKEQRMCELIFALRRSLASFVRSFTPSQLLLPIKTPPTSIQVSIFTIKDALLQSAGHDLPKALSDLNILKRDFSENKVSANAVMLQQRIVAKLVNFIEQLLTILYQNFQKYEEILREDELNLGMQFSLGMELPRNEVNKNLEHLNQLLQPAILSLERMLESGKMLELNVDFELLLRRLKDALFNVVYEK